MKILVEHAAYLSSSARSLKNAFPFELYFIWNIQISTLFLGHMMHKLQLKKAIKKNSIYTMKFSKCK